MWLVLFVVVFTLVASLCTPAVFAVESDSANTVEVVILGIDHDYKIPKWAKVEVSDAYEVVMFTGADIEAFESERFQFRLTEESADRLYQSRISMWINYNVGSCGFEVRVNGEVVCRGKFHSYLLSSLPKAGRLLGLPLDSFKNDRTVRVGYYPGPSREHVKSSDSIMSGIRLVEALREAGVVVE